MAGEIIWAHAFEFGCAKADIEHRTTKPPWTNGQVERMNRAIKDAPVRRFHYENRDQLRRRLADFVAAYNFGRRLRPHPLRIHLQGMGVAARTLHP